MSERAWRDRVPLGEQQQQGTGGEMIGAGSSRGTAVCDALLRILLSRRPTAQPVHCSPSGQS